MNFEHQLKRCLIANRGEIAVRIIHACRELNIETVAVYSNADADASHVRLADFAVNIGPAASTESYLNPQHLLQAAQTTHCDCLHPGYGFLSESADFAQAVIDSSLIWIGPNPETIRQMGVKTEARALMGAAGVPLVPGFDSDTADDAAFIAAAQEIGYPVMVKAAGGGGGKGIRVVREPADLTAALESARREARNAFGDSRIFLEKFIESGRHVEVQVIGDQHGNVLHLYERECSAQRRHQKIIEESPSPLLDDDMRTEMCNVAVKAAQAVNYINAGTLEFIATEAGDFYFLEMNTRLQVEHPVTEFVTGVDLVKLQFLVAAGLHLPLAQDDIQQVGHAIECRIYAEDARNNFLPATGHVLRFQPPSGPGIRVDTGLKSGDEITIHYDPMIAKVIAFGRTRAGALARMQRALDEMVILGTTTNVEFLAALLDTEAFQAGTVDTGYVDAHLPNLLPDIPEPSTAVLFALALSENTVQSSTDAAISGTDGDNFSPWNRTDSFRVGIRALQR